MNNILPTLRALNAFTLKGYILDLYRKPTAQLYIDFSTFNARKQLIKKTGFLKSHSYVIGYLACIEALFGNYERAPSFMRWATDTGGTPRSYSSGFPSMVTDNSKPYPIMADALDDTTGILVGTGTNAPANDDYTLQTKIAHGSGAGQLVHGTANVSCPTIVGANVDMVISRPFTNASGGSITVREVGVQTKLYNANLTLLLRDSVNQTIANGEFSLVTYLFRTTV